MNEATRNRLFQLEVTPPPMVWEELNTVLEEDYLLLPLRTRLATIESAAPSDTWNAIELELDRTEAAIPASVGKRLFAMEVMPPASVAQSLFPASEASVVEMPAKRSAVRPIRHWYRYAAGIAIIAVIGLGAVRFFGNEDSNPDVVIEETLNPQALPATENGFDEGGEISNHLPTPANSESSGSKTVAYSSTRSGKGTENNPRIFASRKSSPAHPASVTDEYDPTYALLAKQPGIQYHSAPISYNPTQLGNGNRYLIFINAEGYVIRISQKMADMIGCLYNDAGADDSQCADKMREWRQKMAASTLSPSPGNFMDIIDLLQTIQENRP